MDLCRSTLHAHEQSPAVSLAGTPKVRKVIVKKGKKNKHLPNAGSADDSADKSPSNESSTTVPYEEYWSGGYSQWREEAEGQ